MTFHDESLMPEPEAALRELLTAARKHGERSMFVAFITSRHTQSLIDAASQCFNDAVSRLQFGIAVQNVGVTLRTDENVSLLVAALDSHHNIAGRHQAAVTTTLDELQVDLRVLAVTVAKMQHVLAASAVAAS